MVDTLTILTSDWSRGVPAGGPLHEHAADDAVAGGELHVGHHAAGGARRGGVLSSDTNIHISHNLLKHYIINSFSNKLSPLKIWTFVILSAKPSMTGGMC